MEDITEFRSIIHSVLYQVTSLSENFPKSLKFEQDKLIFTQQDAKKISITKYDKIISTIDFEQVYKKLEYLHIVSTKFSSSQVIEKLDILSKKAKIYLDLIQNNINNFNNTINQIYSNLNSLVNILKVAIEKGDEKVDDQNIYSLGSNLTYTIVLLGEHTDELTDNIKSLQKIVLNLVYDFSDKDQNIVEEIIEKSDNIIEKFKENSNKLLVNHGHEVKKIKNDYNLVLNEFNLLKDSFQQLQKHNEEIQLKLRNYDNNLNVIMDENDENIQTKMAERLYLIEETYAGKINEIDQSYNKALKNYESFTTLVTRAGIYELTQNYKTKSDEENKEYKSFRKYTSWSIIAAIASTLIIFIVAFAEHYYSIAKQDTNYLLLASRLSISVMFFVLAFYLSKQASKHYECYQENHRTFLQLAALEPFMANMTPEEQKEIRKGLIPSYFNQGSDGKFAAKADEIGIPSSIGERLDKGFETIKEMIASKKDSQN